MTKHIFFVLFLIGIPGMFTSCVIGSGRFRADSNIIDHTCRDISTLPEKAITKAKDVLHIAYQHTSHGSQLITGMNCLESFPEYGSTYSWDEAGISGALDLDDYGIPGCEDLSQGDSENEQGDTPWAIATRTLLDNPANRHINVIIWSWCSINGHDVVRYVNNMEKLIAEYPGIVFVFMTGHAEGQSEDLNPGSVHYNNEFIRRHCRENKRILYDFADIEAYDPDGVYFWDQAMRDNLAYTNGNWAVEWIAANPGSEPALLTLGTGITVYNGCLGCAHSDAPIEANLNCILKARAAWWLWAYITAEFF